MTQRRRVQSINPNDPNALAKVIEALEISEGVRGNPGDRKPTLEEVQKMMSGGTVLVGRSSSGVGAGGRAGSSIIPARPSSVAAIAIQDGIVIGWARPSYSGHGKTEVWRSATTALGDAEQIAFTGSTSFVDYQAGDNNEWTYFLRHVVDVSLGANTGPFSDGVTITSSPANEILNAAKQYTSDREQQIRTDMANGDNSTLQAANQNTSNREQQIRTDMASGDNSTLQAANQNTNAREQQIRTDMASGDNSTLQAAKQYADDKISGLNIIDDAPSDGKVYGRKDGGWVEIV